MCTVGGVTRVYATNMCRRVRKSGMRAEWVCEWGVHAECKQCEWVCLGVGVRSVVYVE